MKWSRRRFLGWTLAGLGVGAGGLATWVAVSRHRAARWTRRLIREHGRPMAAPPFRPRPEQWSEQQVTLAWLGHATFLLNFHGAWILTDPALYPRIGVDLRLGTLGPKRLIAPALGVRELPGLDVVLLSHAHMDHLDMRSLRAVLRPGLAVVTARDTADLVRDAGGRRIMELGWGDGVTLRTPAGEVRIEAFEVKHWGQRWPNDRPRGYNGYVLRREGMALIFGGDTAYTQLFQRLRPGGPYAAAIMPIAAYRPWIWNHCTPEEAVQMADAAGARFFVPMHHETFVLSDEPVEEPRQRLEAALAKEPGRLALRQVGETFVVPRG